MHRIAAVALLFAALPLAAQRGPGVTRVPGHAGWPRVPSGPVSLGEIHVERRGTGQPFRGPVPFPSEARQWLRMETPHFVLISSAGERQTRAIAEDFERLTSLLTQTSSFFRVAPSRTRVFVFGDHGDIQPYIGAVRGVQMEARGITFRHLEGSTLLIDSGIRGGDVITPRHELIHDLLRRGDRPLPLWIEEGLAEYYSNAGMPIRDHVGVMRLGKRMSFEQMFAMRSDMLRTPMSFANFYAQSWAAVATLMRRNPRAFFAFLGDVAAGERETDALQKHYRMSLSDLEGAVRKVGAPAVSLLLHRVNIPIDVSAVSRAELLSDLGTLLGRVKGREDEADRHFRAAIALATNDPSVHLAYAESLAMRPECALDARVFADRALAHGGSLGRVLAVIALSFVAQNDKEAARPYLERAFEAMPARVDIAFPLFVHCVETGERETADALFDRLAESAKASDARRLLLRVDIPRADALAREGRLLEAAKILRDLAPKMPGKTRLNLETQAAGLEAAAATPRR